MRALRVIVDVASAYGIPYQKTCKAIGLDYRQLSIPDGTIATSSYHQLLEFVQRESQIDDFGLYVGRFNYLESMHLSLYMAMAGKTLRDWLNMMPSVTSLFGDLGAVKIRTTGDQFALRWFPNKQPHPKRCYLTDSFLSASVLQMDSFCMRPIKPLRVDFTYPQPKDLSVLHSMMGNNLNFEQQYSGIYYARDVLDYPLIHVSTNIYEGVSEEFSVFFRGDDSHTDPFILALHAAVLRQLPRGVCSIESVADDLHLSRRTLQRRLKDRDTSFQKLLQEIKSTIAKKYLEDERLSIIEIAILLGYSDHSTFSAAFKLWNQLTPTEYRDDNSAKVK